MKQKRILLITVIALIVLVSCVNAETLTGTLGGSGYSQTNFTVIGSSSGSSTFINLLIHNLEYSDDTVTYVHFDATGKNVSCDAGAPSGQARSFVGHLDTAGGEQIVTGRVGYQRVFNALGAEQPGYQYVSFNNDWNLTGAGKTGDHILVLDISGSLYGCHHHTYGATGGLIGNGDMGFTWDGATTGGGALTGLHMRTVEETVYSNYSLTKPSGLGIEGTISKNSSISQIYIENSGNTIITSESGMTASDVYLNTPYPQVYVKMKSPAGIWYNSSLLFTPTTITPTPTIPSGYVRTYFTCLDGQTNGVIQDVNIQLKDVEAATWTNYTSDWDGTGHIDTLPGHTINAYADAVGYTSTERLGLNAFDGSYPLIMYSSGIFPPTGDGNVNLVVMVTDDMTQQPLINVELAAYYPNGSSLGGVTGSLGQEVFVVSNDTVMRVAATKPGYIDKTGIITTSHIGPDYLRINLDRETITPTPTRTVVPGEVTVRPTVDPNSPEQNNGDTSLKAQEMMNFIANNGLTLVELCFMVTIFALLGVKLGK